MTFQHGPDRIYGADPDGRLLCEVTFHPRPDGAVAIDHTFVDGSLRGQGIAASLVKAAADRLRSEGRKVVPTCSYAVKWFSEHPEESDLLA